MNGFDSQRARLFGLLVECPYVESKKHCPLNERRSHDLRDRMRWACGVASNGQVEALLCYHDACSNRRNSE